MANITRKAKYGRDWMAVDLQAYRIRIEYHDAERFFRLPTLPTPILRHPAILQVQDSSHNIADPDVYELLRTMDFAMVPVDAQESAMNDFAVLLLRELGYCSVGRVFRTRINIPFLICAENKRASTDVCVLDGAEIVLLVQEDRRPAAGGGDPVAQLVAQAVAAFDTNNIMRQQAGLLPHSSKIIPGITMRGTSPVFFKIPVTDELASGVMSGLYPTTETVVEAHVPVIPRPLQRAVEGMCPLDNRLAILSCYEAFKQFVC
ncbi:hypothetical protein C8R45DRAFT_55537 [Mycena sanguinolenta]|nr:hypothetical protein C8R45DRAFT_55537 [Mycena sanguinolenta]